MRDSDGDNTLKTPYDDGRTFVVALPLHEEKFVISRERKPGDLITVEIVTESTEYFVSEVVFDETVDVTRVAVGREIAADPGLIVRGEVTIIPVLAERFDGCRRLVLVEEIHVTRTRVKRRHEETIVLRRQEARITRHPAGAKAGAFAPEHVDRSGGSTHE